MADESTGKQKNAKQKKQVRAKTSKKKNDQPSLLDSAIRGSVAPPFSA